MFNIITNTNDITFIILTTPYKRLVHIEEDKTTTTCIPGSCIECATRSGIIRESYYYMGIYDLDLNTISIIELNINMFTKLRRHVLDNSSIYKELKFNISNDNVNLVEILNKPLITFPPYIIKETHNQLNKICGK